MNVLRIYPMKIFKIINNNINDNVNKMSSDWDDVASVPDIAENLTVDEHEKNNPLCSDFWVNRIHLWQILSPKAQLYEIISYYQNKIYK